MANSHWSLREIEQVKIFDGYIITIVTNVPCHLWLRYTEEPPQYHAIPLYKRGIFIYKDARFCFVAFKHIEQDEANDTYTHTFTWHGWYHCLTQYFYFWGEISGQGSPSTSPIFSKHFTLGFEYKALCDPGTARVQGKYFDGYVASRNSTGRTCSSAWQSITCMQEKAATDRWNHTRSVLVFDTTTLAPSQNIRFAALTFKCGLIYSPDSGNLCFVDATGITIPTVCTLFEQLKGKSDILAQLAPSEISTVVFQSVWLDSSKLYFINPGGLTKIGIREHNELVGNSSVPPEGTGYGYAICSDKTPGWEPYLTLFGD